jgi:hypothetical protein
MSNRAAIVWFLILISPIPLSVAGAVACSSPAEDAAAYEEELFQPCLGFERPYTEAWLMCMDKMGNGGGLVLERCQAFARALICHPPMKLPPCKCAAEKAKVKRCEDQRKDCVAAKNEQQELRFWKRCGVIRPGDYDQWAECNGGDGAAEMACSPNYGPPSELCSGGNQERYERMRRDGVSWIDCKEGEVCP